MFKLLWYYVIKKKSVDMFNLLCLLRCFGGKEMDKKTIQDVVNSLLFTKEAADYLGISIQRLHQLVSDGQIKPVKKSSAGSLFWKADLDERINDLRSIGSEVRKKSKDTINMDSPFVHEVMNYYTLQSFNNFSDKKTVPIFKELSEHVDIKREMRFIVKDIAKIIGIDEDKIILTYKQVFRSFEKLNKNDYIIKKGMEEYPELLARTEEAPPYLFLRGNIGLLKENIVSVVGSRGASIEGRDKAYRLSKLLGRYNIIVASGLARGIDTAAHTASIENGYFTIAVLGTPITKAYPKENEKLQKEISEKGLVVSQYPPSSSVQRWFFPMRNAVMSGISLATVVVEASETSGSLKQADYALKQGRIVFIPQSALENEKIDWPQKYIKRKGAMKFLTINELIDGLKKVDVIPSNEEIQESMFSEEVGVDTLYVPISK